MNDMVATESQGHPAPGAKSQHELAEMIRDRGSRTSSGPADVSAAPTGRTYDRSRPNRSERQKTLVRKGPSTYPHMAPQPFEIMESAPGNAIWISWLWIWFSCRPIWNSCGAAPPPGPRLT